MRQLACSSFGSHSRFSYSSCSGSPSPLTSTSNSIPDKCRNSQGFNGFLHSSSISFMCHECEVSRGLSSFGFRVQGKTSRFHDACVLFPLSSSFHSSFFSHFTLSVGIPLLEVKTHIHRHSELDVEVEVKKDSDTFFEASDDAIKFDLSETSNLLETPNRLAERFPCPPMKGYSHAM